LTLRTYHRIAFILAAVGQLVVTVGLPLPVFLSSAEASAPSVVDSDCGCCPMDRTAKRCCCNTPLTVAPGVKSCCVKHDAPAATDREREETKAQAKTELKIRWAGGVMRQRCLGQNEHALSAASILAFPAGSPDRWDFDWAFRDCISFHSDSLVVVRQLPDTPPPR